MITSGQMLSDPSDAARPVVHHLRVAEPDDDASDRAKGSIPLSIVFESLGARVELLAVDLDHQRLSDEQIDFESDDARMDHERQPAVQQPKPND